ncbi:MAG: succinate dehydrogenase, hydrophobic membrane anchor protein [Oceanicaulis sp.]|nr:succinate dehydrogenase, hydrophobic membrane anchor protein [Oceanicaulis sp.]MCH8490897.1 succinate dehydrogenase, hydrophobic membrane anchor protein [Oceanicaulis sp.]
MSGLRTPLSRAKGLGSARTGSGHFIAQRVSAVALVILIPAFVWMIARLPDLSYEAARALIASPAGALVMLLTLTAAIYHMRLGLQVVIEDYIPAPVTRAGLLIVNTLIAAGLWLTALYSILVIAA